VQDCIDAMFWAIEKAQDKSNVFNLGTDEYPDVNGSIARITKRLGVTPALTYSGGERGWIGDSPFIFLDTTRIRGLGWQPRLSIGEAIERTVDWLKANEWVFAARV